MTSRDSRTSGTTAIDADPIFEVYFDTYGEKGRIRRDVLAYVKGSTLAENIVFASRPITINGAPVPDHKILELTDKTGSTKILFTYRAGDKIEKDLWQRKHGYSLIAKLLTDGPPKEKKVLEELDPLYELIIARQSDRPSIRIPEATALNAHM